MHKVFSILLTISLFTLIIASCTPPVEEVEKPASFETSNLLVIPATANPGDEVTISVSVANNGDIAGEYHAELKINDAMENSQSVVVEGGNSQKVIFNVSREAEGEYLVSVDSLLGKFDIVGQVASEDQPEIIMEPQTYVITWTDDEFDSFARMLIGKPTFDYEMQFLSGNKLSIRSIMSFTFLVDICDGKLCFKNVDKAAWDNVFKKGDPYLTYDGKGLMTLMDLPEGMPEVFAPGLEELPLIDSVKTSTGEITFTITY